MVQPQFQHNSRQEQSQLLTQAAIGGAVSKSDMVVQIPITDNLSKAIENSLKMGASCQRVISVMVRNSQLNKRF